MKKFKLKFNIVHILILSLLALCLIAVAVYTYIDNEMYEDIVSSTSSDAQEKTMENIETYKIADACKNENVGKKIRIVGFMGGTLAEDGTMAWIIEKPFMSSSQFLGGNENVVCLEPGSDKTFEYSEYAIVATGTLKTNVETGEWYLVDTEIEEYTSDDADRLMQFGTLIESEYTDVIEKLSYSIYETLNFDSINEVVPVELDSTILDEMMSRILEYKDFEYIGSAYIIASQLNELIDKINTAIRNESIKNEKSRLNAEANEIYSAYYSHIIEAGKNIVY